MVLLLLVFSVVCLAAPKRVLYLTHSAGFRHGSIAVSGQVMDSIARRSGAIEVTATEDLTRITAETLRGFDAVFFFTSGELPLTDAQKRDLLEFVRSGKGFGGVHSATDTLYNWPEYGDLIGGYFDGHPWVHEAAIDVEDPDHPTTKHLGPSLRLFEEFYQFRAFSRDRVRVLMTLDTRTVNLHAPGVNRTDEDFALAWCRNYGTGRVFYSALGHFDETWLDSRFQKTLEQALLWLTKELEGDASVRVSVPVVGNVRDSVAPGALMALDGEGLTSGSSLTAASLPLPVKLGGTMVHINGTPAPLVSATPKRLWMQVPFGTALDSAELRVVSGSVSGGAIRKVRVAASAPEIFAVVRGSGIVTIYCTGLGPVQPAVPTGAAAPFQPLSVTTLEPVVTIGGSPAQVLFSGLAPGLAGVYQINVASSDPGAVSIIIGH
ncbi:MAG: ThuA domain-containing protein [Acidobacteriia bacterium]|nr:ThuA domain-containing protein [Terriglobia bacterium]